MDNIDTKTIELFRFDETMPSIEERVAAANKAIQTVFDAGHPCVIAFSGGKDSGVVAALVMNVAADYAARGGRPLVVFTTGDTMVENPEIQEHYRAELKKARDFGQKRRFQVITKIVQPTLAATFQMKILTGRGIPSYAGTSTDCSVDMKVNPQRQYRRKLFKSLKDKNYARPVTCLGTRFDESERRALHMKARGERGDAPVENRDGDLVLSPIAMWTTEDVWEYIGMVTSNIWPAFTDFKETTRIYAHSAGTSCAVVADAIHEGGQKQRKGGCGARHGCHVCMQAEDKSLEAMIEFDERYTYARGLNKLNKFIRAIRFDWSRRHWVGRTIKAGFLCVQPDTFHPATIRELTRYMLQLDHDEAMRARRAGERPKFCLLPGELMVAVDAIQSLNGVAKPFQIWADHRDIWERDIRYDIPEIETVKKTDVPAARFLYVGEHWDETADYLGLTGLRDAYTEALTEGSGCSPELRELPNGRMVWDVDTDMSFDIDSESLAMLVDFERDRLLEMHDAGCFPGGITAGYKWYLSYGTLTLSHSQQSEHDEIARRTAYKDRLGLTVDYSIDELLQKTVSYADLPQAARKAWGSKATTDSSQTNFLSLLDSAVLELEAA